MDDAHVLLHSRVGLVECGGRATIVVRAAERGKRRRRSYQPGKSEMSRSQGAWGRMILRWWTNWELGSIGEVRGRIHGQERPSDRPSEVWFTTTYHECGRVRSVHG